MKGQLLRGAAASYEADSVVERLFRDAKGAQIFDGASEIQKLVIARELLGVRL